MIFPIELHSRPVTTEFLSSPRMTPFDVLSSVGGILGLFMGFSILSGIELIYWFTVGLAENALKKKGVQDSGLTINLRK